MHGSVLVREVGVIQPRPGQYAPVWDFSDDGPNPQVGAWHDTRDECRLAELTKRVRTIAKLVGRVRLKAYHEVTVDPLGSSEGPPCPHCRNTRGWIVDGDGLGKFWLLCVVHDEPVVTADLPAHVRVRWDPADAWDIASGAAAG